MRAALGVVFVTALGVSGCMTEPSPSARFSTGPVPLDYQKRIDAALIPLLSDPDSRKVDYLSSTDGIACGAVNARNKRGGYAGAQPFFATFLMDDTLRELRIIQINDLHYYRGLLVADAHVRDMLRHCGFI